MSRDLAPEMDSVYVEQTILAVTAIRLALRDPVLRGTDSSVDWLPIAECTVHELVFTATALFFLWALPEGIERRTLPDLLHRLR